jgi:Protein of unknown function (DUF4245)
MVNNGGMEPTAEQKPTLGKREGRSPRDMAMSLLILLIPIALLLTFYRVVLGGDEPVRVDPTSAIQQARSAAVFPVAEPAGLGDDWIVTAATFRRAEDGATLRLGYLDPDDDSVLLVQSSVSADTLVPTELGKEGRRTGTFRDDAQSWLRYEGRPGEVSLVLVQQGRTIIVVGKTAAKNVEELAGALF